MKLSAMLICDFYKISHREQYPEKTEVVYSTWTPRISRLASIDHVVAFGFQAFIKKYLIDFFDNEFFDQKKSDIVAEYKRIIKHTLGVENPQTKHIEDLHDLGFLPLAIRAVPEGTVVPLRTPILTVHNTDPRFFWLTNYIETLASCEMWQPSTSATIAYEYRKIFDRYAELTGVDKNLVQFQGHDFSMRGLSSLESAMLSGAGHLLSFSGTDTIPAIRFLEEYYRADVEKELIGTSIPATEHSVMCANGFETDEQEIAAYKRLITEVYPKGFVSIVSDTRDYWNILSTVVGGLKTEILKRDGRVVVRPDSGDPVKIICGDEESENELARKGTVEVLWDMFGGTINELGYKVLDPHIGCIYGEAINLNRAEDICDQLMRKGFASINCIFGIGSFTYQFNTRDTFGFAYKTTHCKIDGQEINLYKKPKTDDGTKHSQKGVVQVIQLASGAFNYVDGLMLDRQDNPSDELKLVFLNGDLLINQSLAEIRARLV
jgi:nicotinamide phosphoribosyltransferase